MKNKKAFYIILSIGMPLAITQGETHLVLCSIWARRINRRSAFHASSYLFALACCASDAKLSFKSKLMNMTTVAERARDGVAHIALINHAVGCSTEFFRGKLLKSLAYSGAAKVSLTLFDMHFPSSHNLRAAPTTKVRCENINLLCTKSSFFPRFIQKTFASELYEFSYSSPERFLQSYRNFFSLVSLWLWHMLGKKSSRKKMMFCFPSVWCDLKLQHQLIWWAKVQSYVTNIII